MNGISTNKSSITVIVTTIAILAIICVGTICVLSYVGTKVPPELNTLTGGLVGYLGAMLTKTAPTEVNSTAPVQVMNTPANPVPTEQKNQP